MNKSNDNLIMKMYNNGQLITHKDKYDDNNVIEYTSSCFLASFNVFIKGEYQSYGKEKQRNAIITIFDDKSNKVLGNV